MRPRTTTPIPTGTLPLTTVDFSNGFKQELSKFGYAMEEEPDSLFPRTHATPPAFLVGLTVQRLQISACHPFTGSQMLNIGNPGLVKGKAFLEIKWELFSVLENKVVYSTTTSGSFEATETFTGNASSLAFKAYLANLTNLAAIREFGEQVTKKRAAPFVNRQGIDA